MYRIPTLAAALATAAVGALMVTASPAAASHDCVTETEYQRVEVKTLHSDGWKVQRVHDSFDGYRGWLYIDEPNYNERQYEACGTWSRFGFVIIRYADSNHEALQKRQYA